MNEDVSHKTFDQQHLLPKLPLPGLDETCLKFIEWIQPLLTESEFNNTKKIVDQFRERGGDGEKLQKNLIQWSQRPDLTNWLEPFWNRKYLSSRIPLPINVNFSTVCDENPQAGELSQVRRSAMLIYLTLRFKSLIDSEELEVDRDPYGPLCMMQFKKLFSTTRIPQRHIDLLRCPISRQNPTSPRKKHIVVLHKGNLFTLNVLRNSGDLRGIGEIEAELASILASGADAVRDDEAIAVLTTMNRDDWADARKALLNIHPRNETLLEEIESALFALCLDDFSPMTLDDRFRAILHGDGKNRWFDKSFQFIVGKNGRFGVSGEHSGLDGYPVHRLIKFIYDESVMWQRLEKPRGLKSECRPRRLKFQFDDRIHRTILKAAKDFNRFIENTSTRVIAFRDFGKDFIKSSKISPDAFVQLALQIALYKLFGKCKSVYEVASTRRFQNGRTETLRSVSNESHQFIKNMLSPVCDRKTRASSLRKAARKHVSRMKACMAGQGVERHLFGLLSIYEQFGKQIGVLAEPELFRDIGWLTLRHDTLSTTSNPDPHGVVLSGFGPVVDDGFGICYTTINDRITIAITGKSNMQDSLEQFTAYLKRGLREMSALLH
ncbi:MAG: choline/carnitine O-acyltransferase [Desulfobacterales bacterium]|jgi:carnitine O-acetyltransferase